MIDESVPNLRINSRILDGGIGKNDGIGVDPIRRVQGQVCNEVIVADREPLPVPASTPVVLFMRAQLPEEEGVQLSWRSVAGRTYVVEQTELAAGSLWTMAAEVTADGETTSAFVPRGVGAYVRVRVLNQPAL